MHAHVTTTITLHLSEGIIASFPGSPFQILPRSFGEKFDFSPKLRDKIQMESLGTRLIIASTSCN